MCAKRSRGRAPSLVIITLTGVAALASHLAAGATPEGLITAALAGSTAVGALCGTLVAQRRPQAALVADSRSSLPPSPCS